MDKSKPPTKLVTAGGVTVVVKDIPPPEPRREPEAPERFPRVVIRPPEQPAQARDTLIRQLFEEHGEFIRQMLLRRRDVLAESAKDVQQRVLVILCDHIEKKKLPDNVRGFLAGTLRKEIANHKRVWKPDVEQEADVDASACAAPDPEGAAELAERWEKLMHYLTRLPEAEAEVFERIELEGRTIDEAAAELRRPRSTVADQLVRAWAKLEEFVRASARATELGERRRPAGPR